MSVLPLWDHMIDHRDKVDLAHRLKQAQIEKRACCIGSWVVETFEQVPGWGGDIWLGLLCQVLFKGVVDVKPGGWV